MHEDPYCNQIEENLRFEDLYERDYIERLGFARDNGCNNLILTGNGEPVMNKIFLNRFSHWNQMLEKPFRWIEVQTSGITLNDEKLRWLRNTVRVTTISLSLSSIFSSAVNKKINGIVDSLAFDIDALCKEIKRYDFTLRLSLNMTDDFSPYTPLDIFKRAEELGANQITFRKLYANEDTSAQSEWVKKHALHDEKLTHINEFILEHGRELETLPFGAKRYSVMNMSTLLDTDCMSTHVSDALRYLILQKNCKLYTKWDDAGSLLF